MKNLIIILAFAILGLTSCVQKTKSQTVILFLDVSGIKNIQNVGVRGEGKPLSWNEDLILTEVYKDSIYKTTVFGDTGRLCAEIKFTVNSEFELKEEENRKVYFDKSGTTIYKAKFNVAQK